ncbi:EcsC family protein [Brackiella oedipodis]|uniref:EcsC family protein n=1 Tax=Brackiella oedipodis TaxID=124225 RepID=UPI000685469A|nr:EcsC family protein [Brackiella oedipodis]
MQPQDLKDLELAVRLLETPSITTQISHVVGKPVDYFMKYVPKSAQGTVNKAISKVLYKTVEAASGTLKEGNTKSANKSHLVAAGLSGAVGGFFGFSGLTVELPLTTTIIMRSIMDIARSEGFSVKDPETRLSCIEVFSFKGNYSEHDDNAESGYYLTRTGLAQITNMTTKELSKLVTQGAGGLNIPSSASKLLARFIDTIAQRFGIVISEKMAAQLVPVLGAAAGASLNALFLRFYQNMAKGHFIVKRLELKYGTEEVRHVYEDILRRGGSLASAEPSAALPNTQPKV